MSFDPMAAAVDWLDAYRAGDIETVLAMYADDAVIQCGCGGATTLTGRRALRTYWRDRLENYPASALANLHPAGDGALISYVTQVGVVSAVLAFTASGKIAAHQCGPSH